MSWVHRSTVQVAPAPLPPPVTRRGDPPNADGSVPAPPVGPGDGMDPSPTENSPAERRAREAETLAEKQAAEQHLYTMSMMRIQHQQAIQKIVIESAAAVSKNAADISEFVANKI